MIFSLFEPITQLNIPEPDGFVGFQNSAEGFSTLGNPSPSLVESLIGFPSASGIAVTRERAIRCVTFLSGVSRLASDVSKMPLDLMLTTGKPGSERTSKALDNPLYPMLRYSPNEYMTSYQLRWANMFSLLTAGNFYVQKITDQTGQLIGLMPLNPWTVKQRWDFSDPKKPVRFFDYQEAHVSRTFKNEEIWTCSSMAMHGLEGTAITALAKDALAILIASDEVSGRFFANGLNMHGFLTAPKDSGITEKQAQDTVDRLKRDFTGSARSQKFSFLPGGVTYQKMQLTSVEAQLLESRKFNAEEIIRLLGGAPLIVKLGYGSNTSTYASSAAFLEEYYSTSLLPFVVNIEQSIIRDLIDPKDRGRLTVHHDADIVLRGSPLERAQKDEIEIRSGKVTPNEARLRDHKDPIEGWDVCFFPSNSGVFDPKTQQMFIPAQAVSEEDKSAANANANKNENPNENPVPVPPEKKKKKVVAPPEKPEASAVRLSLIALSLAERVLRKEKKAGSADAGFVAEVLACSLPKAEEYCSKRKDMTDEVAKQALIKLVTGD